jgi:hypothetical protein
MTGTVAGGRHFQWKRVDGTCDRQCRAPPEQYMYEFCRQRGFCNEKTILGVKECFVKSAMRVFPFFPRVRFLDIRRRTVSRVPPSPSPRVRSRSMTSPHAFFRTHLRRHHQRGAQTCHRGF